MKVPNQIDELLNICEALCEHLRTLSPHDELLGYDFDKTTNEEEKEALKKRFFENFGPKYTTVRDAGEEIYIIMSLTNFRCKLLAVIAIKTAQGVKAHKT